MNNAENRDGKLGDHVHPYQNQDNALLKTGVISFAAFTGAMMQSLVVPILASLPDKLNTDPSMVSWLMTAMLLSGAVSNVVFGKLSDLYGKRKIILVCLSLMILGSVIGASTNQIGLLILARVLQGAAIAVVPIGISCLAESLAGRSLVRGISLVSAMVGIGASLGFVFAAVIAQYFDWHLIFALSGLLGTAAFIGVITVFPHRPGNPKRSFDLVGALGLSFGMCCFLMGISNGHQWGWTSVKTCLIFIAAVLILVLWLKNQYNKNEPLVNVRVAMRPAIFRTNIATILVGFSMYSIVLTQPMIIQLPTALGYGLGLSILAAGLSFLPGGIISLVLPSVATHLSVNSGPSTTVVLGGLAMALGYLLLTFFHSSLLQLVLCSIFVAIGTTLCLGALPMAILQHTPKNETGQATGVNNLARSIGTSTSIACSVAVMGSSYTELHSQLFPSERSMVIIYSLSCASSILICAVMYFVPTKPNKNVFNRAEAE